MDPGSGFFFFNDAATTEMYTLSLHDALPIYQQVRPPRSDSPTRARAAPHHAGRGRRGAARTRLRSRPDDGLARHRRDRKSTRLNSSHDQMSYAAFCLTIKKHTVSRRASLAAP